MSLLWFTKNFTTLLYSHGTIFDTLDYAAYIKPIDGGNYLVFIKNSKISSFAMLYLGYMDKTHGFISNMIFVVMPNILAQ
jgi:hypothetical protein